MTDVYQPKPEHRFTFGLRTVGNPGRDPFGEAVRPVRSPVQLAHLRAEVGAIYKENARGWNEDKDIQGLLRDLAAVPTDGLPTVDSYSRASADSLKAASFDKKALGARGLGYERLDPLTLEVILGIR